MEEAEPTLRALRQREEAWYLPSIIKMRSLGRGEIREYLRWRRDMVLWFFYTANDYGIRAETVEAAQCMLDRLSAIEKGTTEDFDVYQLSSFVCLLIGCKTLEAKHFFRKSKIRKLGRDFFSQSELDHTELDILYSLKWHIQPPSSIEIANKLLEIVADLGLVPDYAEIKEKITLHLIHAIVDSRFLPFKKSSIALAAFLSVMRPRLKDDPFRVLQTNLEEILMFTEHFEDELVQLQSMMEGPNTMNTPVILPSLEPTSHDHIHMYVSSPTKQTLEPELFQAMEQEELQTRDDDSNSYMWSSPHTAR